MVKFMQDAINKTCSSDGPFKCVGEVKHIVVWKLGRKNSSIAATEDLHRKLKTRQLNREK
ncbi:hypothetical protein KFK09_027522 [Dendrobium nobile]|uniref:Uncharacterized protein n=1 Tax=Dendrobium nobile TaxID=94219 RepID=A0A8T3A9J7_DENNO|nr:hypothetical protein KFK09_027522 [Dendrobium nobile]